MPWHHPYTVVDTHCHAGLRKYEPIESLLDQMFRNGVDQAVLVQHLGEYDNTYLSDCAKRYPGRFVVAILVEPTQSDAAGVLVRWAEWPGVAGLRMECTYPEPLWQQLNELGMPATMRGTLADLASPETRRRIERYPRVSFCIEHLGFPDATEAPPYHTYQQMLALAQLPNVYLKVSGYYGFTQGGYPYTEVFPFARLALDAFGPRRMMWGSDFPPVSGREGYHNALAFVDTLYPDLSTEEKAWLMGKTAQQVWGLEQ